MKSLRLWTFSVMTACAVGTSATWASAEDDEQKGPPLPFHTIEGVGGGAITPMAYLVNPAAEGELFGKPAVAGSYVGIGQKNLTALTITENVGGRLEFGYAANRLGLGTLPAATGYAFTETDVWLHHFNARALLVKENANDNPWLPAITFGTDLKYNSDISSINRQLATHGLSLENIGYNNDVSADLTLTATKTFAKGFFGRPLIVNAGIRESQGAQLGFLGFGDTYRTTFEGSVAIVPLQHVLIAYEFRQKANPYSMGLAPVIGEEDNWNAIDVAFIMSKHSTLVAGWGAFGNIANANADKAWWLQLKYEF